MGRHTQPRKGATVLVAALAAAALVGGGAVAWIALGGDEEGSAAVSQPQAVTAGAAASPTSATDAASSQESTPDQSADPGAALDSCWATVSAGNTLADALIHSGGDWQVHTDAQRRLDAGQFTKDQAAADWADTKSRGDADVAAVHAARASWDEAAPGCQDLQAVGPGANSQAQACLARYDALTRFIPVGTVVADQWQAHVKMMAGKSMTDPNEYHERWVAMVTESAQPLADFAVARAELDQAPTC
ncbi:MAG: hypothetical protein ACK5MT_14660 [Actinomycetales bacterium]